MAGAAFDELPWSLRLFAPREDDEERRLPPTLEEIALASRTAYFVGRFDGPAHIPLPTFGPEGERFADEGAVIYEGMRVVLLADGRYEARLTVGIPKMPVTMRLQLVVAGPCGEVVGLTLPPIRLLPRRSFRGNWLGEIYEVRHRGYSAALAERYARLCGGSVARQGTARFGSWPEGINAFDRIEQIP